jgi:hypothetical protein
MSHGKGSRPDLAERNRSAAQRAACSAAHKGKKKRYRCGAVARPIVDRIDANSMPVPWTGCWLWLRTLDRDGYGSIQVNKRHMRAHRVSYETHRGPIPDGLQIDHLCRVRCCVNPDHLEPVTCRENLMRGDTAAARYAAATVCKHGHPFDQANTLYTREGRRVCHACRNARALAAYHRRRKQCQIGE